MRWLVGIALVGACVDDGGVESGTDTATNTDPSTTTVGTMQGSGSSSSGSSGSSGPLPTTTPSTTQSGTGTGTDTGTGAETTTGSGDEATVLVTVDHGASPPALTVIDPANASTRAQCDLAPSANYGSIVFTRDGELLVHNLGSDRVERINPCDCGFQVVGDTDVGTLEMTVDAGDGLHGVTADLDAYVTVEPATGLASIVGPLGVDVVDSAVAWSDAEAALYVLDAMAEQLYVLDTRTGMLGSAVVVGTDVTQPGMDTLGDAQTLYVCSGTTLYTLDTATGMTTSVGALDLSGTCTTLAGPREAIECLEP